MRSLKLLHEKILSIVISFIVAGGAIGGYFIGRHTTRDAYVEKVNGLLAIGNRVVTLYEALGKEIDDPLTAQALAGMYGVAVGDRAALVQRLRDIVVGPPYRPAPFVGHMARPVFGDDLHINVLGFRDERHNYITKPERTVRVFITGGSTAWGHGASSQKKTFPYLLEQILNDRISRATGYRYEVINAAFPAWSTTQEKLLIQQRLVDMHPDVVIMFSGANDVFWAMEGTDIRWFFSWNDLNYMTLLNELFRSSGHLEWTFAAPFSSHPIACPELARMTTRNVEEAAFAAERANARLIFALQPNIMSVAKPLTQHEQRVTPANKKPVWDACYRALRDALGQITIGNYLLLDLSRSFGELDGNTEIFIDALHFGDLGNRLIAEAFADQIDWRSIVPSGAVTADSVEPLTIVNFGPTEWEAGKPFNQQPDGNSAIWLTPSRLNKNLLIVFDQSVLPTGFGGSNMHALIPPSRYATRGEHKISVMDGVTGEISPPVVFRSR